MYGRYLYGGLLILLFVFIGVFVEPILGEQLAIMAMAPGAEQSPTYRYTAAVANNLLLFLLLSVVVLVVAGALVERELGGGV